MAQTASTSVPDTITRLRTFQLALDQLKLQHDELMEKYPDHWVAMNSDGVLIAAHKDNFEFRKMYDREERNQGRIATQFMDTNPPPFYIIEPL